ncbi:hypothetical protein GJAV_G00190000 [Gymnothorax javanicus]|nr:hypothetical protein GJAV_G00190000 [Gymnothorax javanicus]
MFTCSFTACIEHAYIFRIHFHIIPWSVKNFYPQLLLPPGRRMRKFASPGDSNKRAGAELVLRVWCIDVWCISLYTPDLDAPKPKDLQAVLNPGCVMIYCLRRCSLVKSPKSFSFYRSTEMCFFSSILVCFCTIPFFCE